MGTEHSGSDKISEGTKQLEMQIVITMQGQAAQDRDTSQFIRRVQLGLSRFASSIKSVACTFTDTNGPKGGIDTRCTITVKLRSAGEIIIQGHGDSGLSALNNCLPRLSRAVSRTLDRRRETPIRMQRRTSLTRSPQEIHQ